MEIHQSLQQFGLEGREARVYLATLKLGQSRVSEIAQESGYERTYCYAILKNLEKEGLINKIEPKGKIATFIAEPPKKLEELAKKRLQEIKKIMPDMQSMFVADDNQPVVKYYSGPEGIRQIYGAEKPNSNRIYGILNPTAAYEAMGNYFDQNLKRGIKMGVEIYDLVVQGEKSNEYIAKKKKWGALKTKYLVGNANLKTDFLIWDDKVALISFKEPIHGYVIKSQAINDAWTQIFKVLWNLSK